MFTNLVNISSTISKDAFAYTGGNIGEIINQIRETVAIEMIFFLLENMSRYHHHQHRVTPLLYNNATPILLMDHQLYHVICHHSPLQESTPSQCYPCCLYVDHHLLFM